jgi:Sulfotransferase family
MMDRDFTADALTARATVDAGLSNFGDDDFRAGLDRFIAACRDDGFVPPSGLAPIGDSIVRILANRLRFENTLERHPEILDERIVAPLFIVGAGRVGSTKLHRLLANAIEVQSTPLWQVMNPVPLTSAEPGGEDMRIGHTKAFCDQIRRDQPQLYAAIEPAAEEPDEDPYMFDMSFMQLMFLATANVPSYVRWIYQQDWHRPVAYHKKMLQFLQWQNGTAGKPMLLKGPSHTPHMDALLALFPDAKFVQIHRDPLTCIASMAKVVWMLHQLQPVPHLDTLRDSAEMQQFVMKQFIVDSLKIRDSNPSFPIADFYYEDVRDDATGLARRVFDFWGQSLSDESVARMAAWETTNAQHKLGRFEYSVAEAGIDLAVYRVDFAPYLARFYPNA